MHLKKIPTEIKHYNRYQIVALNESNISKREIAGFIGCSIEIVSRWSKRSSINDKPRSGRPVIYSEEIRLKLIAFYCQTKPLPACGRWTLRWAEMYLQKYQKPVGVAISHSTIQRILKQHNLKPHLVKYFLQITDPNFFPKMERLLPLYFDPPDHFYSFDECPGIQILQRLAPDLQTEEMKKLLKEFEYTRNGTVDVLAFLHVKSGKIFADCCADHKSETFLNFFQKHLESIPGNENIYYCMDNLASHVSYNLCKLVAKYCNIVCPSEKQLSTMVKRREWLQLENKRIVFYFTPFHGSWLNMVEIWFGILNQKCLKESYNSAESIINAIHSFISEWNSYLAHPFKWNYVGMDLQEKTVLRFIKILEDSVEKMNIKFMTKQFLLMSNIKNQYSDKIEPSIWKKLHDLIQSNYELFDNLICQTKGPIIKERSKHALQNVIKVLNEPIIID